MRNFPAIVIVLLFGLMAASAAGQTDTAPAEPDAPAGKSPARMMAELRRMMLTSDPAEFGFDREKLGQRAYGAIMEMPLGDRDTASVVSFADGGGSLYTTGTFGVMGGIGHESVRAASKRFVALANQAVKHGERVTQFPYPESNRVYIYILTFDGVFVIRENISNLNSRASLLMPLFIAGQDVLKQLQVMTRQMENTPPPETAPGPGD